VGLVGILLFALVTHAWFFGCAPSGPSLAFDAGEWKANGELNSGGSTVRRRMLEDLMEHHLHVGDAEESALELLGAPEFTWPDSSRPELVPRDGCRCRSLYYWLWNGPRLLEAEFLVVQISDDGTVGDLHTWATD